ncbi:MAG: gamma-glutamyl-gamma-aminobutyrate hydrolase family protein [Calditrichae bacterium]|nr:gamma-glutamyl-gamma-aminobutyrate hydrolase family protein [Calditrichia bacterium]
MFSRKRPLLLDAERDALEFRLLEAAVKQHIPVLGICRGAQLVNIHFQGSLYQNIRGFYSERPQVRSILPRKRIYKCIENLFGPVYPEAPLFGVPCPTTIFTFGIHP